MIEFDRDANLNVPVPGKVSGGRINIKVNSLGFRGDEFSREKPANTVRVACLGASTTFCAEVSSNHHTWPYLLQERLRKAYPGVTIEVVNAALGGYVADDNLKNLRHRVMPLDPDLVLLRSEQRDRPRHSPRGREACFARTARGSRQWWCHCQNTADVRPGL